MPTVLKKKQVAPAELEAVLLDHPKVADSGVVGVADERAGELPRAYIVKKDASLTQEEVQAYMNRKTPFAWKSVHMRKKMYPYATILHFYLRKTCVTCVYI